ncbi:cupin domain protein [Rhizodiscina lignyota]|uniref:Cupin domain protein n=1 Tax=Rhizodiscina lignyota TaxID=1504668 RepID=A0A9P4M2D5_9PEZI|nr:cupin domain protein [Rhizodiscina lignyota]
MTEGYVLEKAPHASIQLLYSYPLVNVPGFSILTLKVTFPPRGATPPHRHGGASVSGVILRGTAYNKMNDEPTMVLTAGESWYEAPGCHHRISANASETEEMELMATFVVETKVAEEGGMAALVQIDEEFVDLMMPPKV